MLRSLAFSKRRWGSRRRQTSLRKIFERRNNAVKRKNWFIQMPVIHRLDDLIIDNVFENFQVNNHSCHLIRFAIQRYFEDVIVPMPVARGALTVQDRDFAPRKGSDCSSGVTRRTRPCA